MLSRLAFRHVTAAPLILSSGRTRASACVLFLRDYSTDKPADSPVPADKPAVPFQRPPHPKEVTIKQRCEYWDAANKLYFGPDRDLVNFPTLVRPMHTPPVRLAFIPDSFFQLFYEKTGVTGPYVFGVGLIGFLFSKELWLYEHQFTHFVAFWMAIAFLWTKFGAKVKDYLTNYEDALDDKHWHKPLRKASENAAAAIKETEKFIWREAGQKYLYQAKRENVDFQLEAAYRQRLAEVGQAVKRRLDYQLDVDMARRRIHQQHMVQWIVDGVLKGITPQQEKESIAKCIQDLKSISAQQSTATA